MIASNLNAVCPYYTMYPLDFPLRALQPLAGSGSWVLDPFCGRGTTNFAARLLNLPSIGIDTSPVAVAIANAKMVSTHAHAVIQTAEESLAVPLKDEPPSGDFWKLAYHADTLRSLMKLRTGLAVADQGPAGTMLRALVLGALHGPRTKGPPSYFSNQAPRTFAPKPRYAVRFWRSRQLEPPKVDVLDVIRRRAERYLHGTLPQGAGFIVPGDSRRIHEYIEEPNIACVITSPPYYGMKTYVPDQWLRSWFLGGTSEVSYSQPEGSLNHLSPAGFAAELRSVWNAVARVCKLGAEMVCRFGGIHERKADPLQIALKAFEGSEWHITAIRSAGTALYGKRQSKQFGSRADTVPRCEFDIYAVRTG
jgi:hypothetical protein